MSSSLKGKALNNKKGTSLKFQIIKVGHEGSSRPLAGQEVCIRCEGTLQNGDKIDTRERLEFVIGDGDVIPGQWSTLLWN